MGKQRMNGSKCEIDSRIARRWQSLYLIVRHGPIPQLPDWRTDVYKNNVSFNVDCALKPVVVMFC